MYWALSLPIIAVLIWSINIVVTRYADFISPVSISFYRWFFAFILLTPLLCDHLCRQWALIRSAFGAVGSAKCIWSGVVSGLSLHRSAPYTTATQYGTD